MYKVVIQNKDRDIKVKAFDMLSDDRALEKALVECDNVSRILENDQTAYMSQNDKIVKYCLGRGQPWKYPKTSIYEVD